MLSSSKISLQGQEKINAFMKAKAWHFCQLLFQLLECQNDHRNFLLSLTAQPICTHSSSTSDACSLRRRLTCLAASWLALIQALRLGLEPQLLCLESQQCQQHKGRDMCPTSAAHRALPAGKQLQLGWLPVRQRPVSKTSM